MIGLSGLRRLKRFKDKISRGIMRFLKAFWECIGHVWLYYCGYIVVTAVILVVGTLIFIWGNEYGKTGVRGQAIDAKVAEWVVVDKFGTTEFVWKNEKK